MSDIAFFTGRSDGIATRRSKILMASLEALSRAFRAPRGSEEHRFLRETAWMGGDLVACRYYLGIIQSRDFFAVSNDVFLEELRDYLSQQASREAIEFFTHEGDLQIVSPILKHQCELAEGAAARLSKECEALLMLLHNPDWSDERICRAVNTTYKQLRRWSTYNLARIYQARHRAG